MVRMPREPGPTRLWQLRSVGALLALSLPIVLVILMVGGGASARQLDGFILNLVLAPRGHRWRASAGDPARARARLVHAYHLLDLHGLHRSGARGAPSGLAVRPRLFILDDVIGGDLIVRTMVVLAIFTGALHGGVHPRRGCRPSPAASMRPAHAVGLNQFQAMQLIILPQALRISIPPIAGQAISIWKDTTLVTVILTMREFKGNADSAIAQADFIDDRIEAYVFVALGFWIVAFMMSRVSQRMERAQGVGE